ncbi:cuticle protein AMP1A-like [Panulirus ornatus]|uniref:cuticle protein AMP1A-like n=1 Tax=Panulirus ornatus TaxID=150431 RepID=UPI003A8B519F
MKLVVLTCLAAVAIAAPQLQDVRPEVLVLRDERQDDGNGNFNYVLEADNGIYIAASGTRGLQGQANIEGSYSLLDNNGELKEVRYIANENGFQPQSDLLPTPHPLPDHVVELINIAEQQRADGITFE